MRKSLILAVLGLIGVMAWTPSQAMAFSPSGQQHTQTVDHHKKGGKKGGGKHAGKHKGKHHHKKHKKSA